MIEIDLRFVLNVLFRIGLILLAFYLGTKRSLFTDKFANFSMFAMKEECRDKCHNCEECMYYSRKKQQCGVLGAKPKDWDVRSTIFSVKREDV